jgi:hypothetical protein
VKLAFLGHMLYVFIADCGTRPHAQSDVELD